MRSGVRLGVQPSARLSDEFDVADGDVDHRENPGVVGKTKLALIRGGAAANGAWAEDSRGEIGGVE